MDYSKRPSIGVAVNPGRAAGFDLSSVVSAIHFCPANNAIGFPDTYPLHGL